MSRVTHVCLVRHGESAWNLENRVQGQLDPDLSELGERQAEAVARRLAGESWSALYSSDLKRARRTAEAVAGKVGLDIRERRELRERHQGLMEGLLAEEARRRFPDLDAPEVGREPWSSVRKRAGDTLAEIVRAHPGERVLVVTHGGLIRAYLELIGDLGPELKTFPLDNTGLTRVEWTGDIPRITCINDIAHLTEADLLRPA